MGEKGIGEFVCARVHQTVVFAFGHGFRVVLGPGRAVENRQTDFAVFDAAAAFAVVEEGNPKIFPVVRAADVHPRLAGFFHAVHRPLDEAVWNGIGESPVFQDRWESQLQHFIVFLPVNEKSAEELRLVFVKHEILNDHAFSKCRSGLEPAASGPFQKKSGAGSSGFSDGDGRMKK